MDIQCNGETIMAGRPHKFNSPEEMQQKIDEYFAYCDENKKPYIVTGLALHLDTTRELLTDYQDKDEFYDTIKKAKQKIMEYAESALFRNSQVAGVIFNLKNNYSNYYKDKIFTEDETDYTEQEKKLEALRNGDKQ